MEDSLGDRMKAYERTSQGFLKRKYPVIGRIDGKAFHTITRGLQRPLDPGFQMCMQYTSMCLLSDIEGCAFVYSQSDEINVLLRDYASVEQGAWFSYNIQKLCSVAASIASVAFNEAAASYLDMRPRALFDARFFTIPQFADVSNYFIWRQIDAVRNSIGMHAEDMFSSKLLYGKSSKERLKLMKDQGFDWLDTPPMNQRGFCVYRRIKEGEEHAKIHIDRKIPNFIDDREFVERFVYLREYGNAYIPPG